MMVKRVIVVFFSIVALLVFAGQRIGQNKPIRSAEGPYKVYYAYKTIPAPVKEYNMPVVKELKIKVKDGKAGKLEEMYIIKNGVKVPIAEFTVKEPEPAVYYVGNAKPPKHYLYTITAVATAYSPRVCETDSTPWITATGRRSGFGIVAVDPHTIPLGTKLYVEGYGYGIAGDTGGVIKGNKIDLFFYDTKQAYWWGRRKVKVYVISIPGTK